MHYNSLPNVHLPDFYGNSLEFPKWWQMFTYLVDLNEKIPVIMKLNILQKALKGDAEELTHQITFSPECYSLLKEMLLDKYDDTDAAAQALNERLRNFPIVKKNDYESLTRFVGFATNYIMQLAHFEHGALYHPRNVLRDLMSKFNTDLHIDYDRAWTEHELLHGKQSDQMQVTYLISWLKTRTKLLRKRYVLDPNRKPIPLGMPSGIATEFNGKKNGGHSNNNGKRNGSNGTNGKKATTADNLSVEIEEEENAEVFKVNTRSGTSGGGKEKNSSGSRKNNSPPSNNSNKGPAPNRRSSDKSDKGVELKPCTFCNNQDHSAAKCTQNMKPDTVYIKAYEAYLCLNCLRAGHFASKCPHPGCSVNGCKSKHHQKMHGHKVPAKQAQ